MKTHPAHFGLKVLPSLLAGFCFAFFPLTDRELRLYEVIAMLKFRQVFHRGGGLMACVVRCGLLIGLALWLSTDVWAQSFGSGLQSFQCVNYPDRYIRHASALGITSPVNTGSDAQTKADATFRVVQGLADPASISFESKNYPGHYLRHQGYRIKLHKNDNTQVFKEDATFYVEPGLANASLLSFRSFNYPVHYIRHRNSELWIDERSSEDLYRQDATFRAVLPWSDPRRPNPPPQPPVAGRNDVQVVDPFSEVPDMCWKDSYGRGVGTIPTRCDRGVNDAGLCYPSCRNGYIGAGPVCWQNCPSGFTDTGGHCLKPEAYGRGFGFGYVPIFESRSKARTRCESEHGRGNCERCLEMYYPKCKAGFSPAGCNICSPNCPRGTTDIGVSCQKDSYGRGVGTIPTGCGSKENDAGLCYPQCNSFYNGIGPVCWSTSCPREFPVDCAAGCAKSAQACAENITNQVVTPLEMVTNITGLVFSGGGSAVATAAARTSARTIAKSTIKSQLKRKAREVGKELAEEAAESAAATFYEAQLTGEFSWTDLDPTGVANVVAAFYKPLCKDYR